MTPIGGICQPQKFRGLVSTLLQQVVDGCSHVAVFAPPPSDTCNRTATTLLLLLLLLVFGNSLSGSFDGLVMVWDIGSGQPLHTYRGHQYQVTAVVVLPTGDIASASVDK